MLLLGAPALAGASSGQQKSLLEQGFSEAEDFARYADVASRRQKASQTPPVVISGRAMGRRTTLPAWGGGERWRATSRVSVPVPQPEAAPARPARKNRTVSFLQLVGLTLFAIGFSGAASRRHTVYRFPPPAQSPLRRVEPTLPAPKPFEPEPLAWGPDPEPKQPPIWVPPGKDFSPWWAITMREQAAIERWDASFEKEFGMMSLGSWLKAHAGELRDVDAELLAKKISRDS